MLSLEKINENLIDKILKNSKTLEYRDYKSEDTIVNIGDKINKFGIIIKGNIEIASYTYDGEKKSNQYLTKDHTIPIHAIYYQFLNKDEYKYSLECESDSTIAWIDREEFISIIKSDPQILYEMLLQESIKGYKAQVQLNCMSYNKVRERLACWIVEVSELEKTGYIEIPRTQSIFADTLYVNRSSLNQELKKLKEEKLIDIDGNVLKVLDIEKLKESF